ncbi:MAG: von Willebrand factor type A domain-containing protein [Planctomycetaceae bacterium]
MTSDEHDLHLGPDREERDALLSAHALGELSGPDLDAVERLLADPGADDARRTVAETRDIAAALRAGRGLDLPPPSADLRRAVVAALTVAPPTESRHRHSRISGWLALAGTLAATVLVAVSVLQPGPAARTVAQRRIADEKAPPAPPAAAASERARPGVAARTRRQEKTVAPADREIVVEALARQPAPTRPQEIPTSAGARVMDAEGRGGTWRFFHGPAARLGEPAPANTERFGRVAEQGFLTVADRPLSTFSIDVDTASYAVVRRFLSGGQLPPADAVRIEELLNSFRYSYPQPVGDDPFAVALEAADCPWRSGHRLVRIGIAARDVDRARRPAGNLVFLIDVSGSMDEPDKLPLAKQSLAMLVEELTENDRVSIVTYAGDAGVKLPPTSGDQKRRILDVIEGLAAGGSTHGSVGIELAYAQARERFIPGGANRVILCTDGDLNVGITSDVALVELVREQARGGTFLTVLGFGRGNLQDEKLEAIADRGNGIYAYVDGVREARKILVEQLTGSTITIAKDVKIQIEFNPATVASYRLIGYENRRLADADFRDDAQDAGEIGAGHTVTALYEIVPAGVATGGDGAGAEPLKYQADAPRPAAPVPAGPASGELLTVKLRFKEPEGDSSVLREFPLADRGGAFAAASADTRFAAAVAAFGMILRGSEFKGEATLPLVATIAGAALGTDEGGYRAEFLDLVRKAEMIRNADRPK